MTKSDTPLTIDKVSEVLQSVWKAAVDNGYPFGTQADFIIERAWQDIQNEHNRNIQEAILEARIDEVTKLCDDQVNFVKAQSGHVRNNNNWPRTRGAGKTAKDAVAWLDRRLKTLNTKKDTWYKGDGTYKFTRDKS